MSLAFQTRHLPLRPPLIGLFQYDADVKLGHSVPKSRGQNRLICTQATLLLLGDFLSPFVLISLHIFRFFQWILRYPSHLIFLTFLFVYFISGSEDKGVGEVVLNRGVLRMGTQGLCNCSELHSLFCPLTEELLEDIFNFSCNNWRTMPQIQLHNQAFI